VGRLAVQSAVLLQPAAKGARGWEVEANLRATSKHIYRKRVF
jgi:hypothetical protein